mgnify:CR=1 FL=1
MCSRGCPTVYTYKFEDNMIGTHNKMSKPKLYFECRVHIRHQLMEFELNTLNCFNCVNHHYNISYFDLYYHQVV